MNAPLRVPTRTRTLLMPLSFRRWLTLAHSHDLKFCSLLWINRRQFTSVREPTRCYQRTFEPCYRGQVATEITGREGSVIERVVHFVRL